MNKVKQRRIKSLILLSLSIVCIGFGIALFFQHFPPFFRGYTAVSPITEKEVVEVTPIENDSKGEVVYLNKPDIGDEMGVLTIPKLNAELPIFYGTSEDELEKGVGHFAGSVLPGLKDNSVLSGHRDTVFRRLGEVGVDDLLVVTTEAGEFTYKVRKVRIVDEDDRTVIVPRPKATLTVTTCYPFDFIGSAPERYVLVADLVEPE
ncbi:class D sortase [Alkalihalobacillus sp. LMS39]|uniref:class D sortase n=1 Tax=Alkalihalobacillus sp. LMS39 TaxID=2924032 RepID=UPI001FB22753|nr:class D sortase [Alkalihalobacillus sp. LMS39]UOE93729.1 class D sortase [Alkalihalobacillus sp. LMS39]